MSRIVRTPQSAKDYGASSPIDRHAPASADELLRELDEVIAVLALQPLLGQSLDRVRPKLRMFTKGNYVVFYEPLEDGLLVHRVLHAARDWRELI